MNILDKLTGRERTILYILVAIVTLALIYNFLMEPLFKRWNSINREIDLVKVRLHKAISIRKDKDKIDEEYAVYAKRLKPKGSDEQEMTHILNALEILASSSNLKIVNMRPKPPRDKEYYKKFIVEIETESNMRPLMKFIYEVRNSPQLLKVDRLRLNTKSSQAGVIIRASMVISKISIE